MTQLHIQSPSTVVYSAPIVYFSDLPNDNQIKNELPSDTCIQKLLPMMDYESLGDDEQSGNLDTSDTSDASIQWKKGIVRSCGKS